MPGERSCIAESALQRRGGGCESHDGLRVVQEGYEDLFKGKGHKHFEGAYLQLWDRIIQHCSDQEVLLTEPLLEKVCHLSTGLSRCPPPPASTCPLLAHCAPSCMC